MNVFDLSKEYVMLNDMAFEYDEETGEIINNDDTLKELIDELNEAKEQKLNNIEYLKRSNKSNVDALAAEIKRLQSKKKAIENTNERLKTLQEILLNGEKLKTDKFTFSYRNIEVIKVPGEVDPKLDTLVNAKYTWDKKAIKDSIKNKVLTTLNMG